MVERTGTGTAGGLHLCLKSLRDRSQEKPSRLLPSKGAGKTLTHDAPSTVAQDSNYRKVPMANQNALFPEMEERPAPLEPRGFRYREEIVTKEGGCSGSFVRTTGPEAL